MVLGPVSYPAKIHCTAIFALGNGKFSGLGLTLPPDLFHFEVILVDELLVHGKYNVW